MHAVANQLPRVALGWHTRAAGGEPARGGGAEVVVHEVVQLSAAVSAYHCTFTYLWVGPGALREDCGRAITSTSSETRTDEEFEIVF